MTFTVCFLQYRLDSNYGHAPFNINKPSVPRFKLSRRILLSNVSHIATSWNLHVNRVIWHEAEQLSVEESSHFQLTPEDRQKDCQDKLGVPQAQDPQRQVQMWDVPVACTTKSDHISTIVKFLKKGAGTLVTCQLQAKQVKQSPLGRSHCHCHHLVSLGEGRNNTLWRSPAALLVSDTHHFQSFLCSPALPRHCYLPSNKN